MVSGGSFDHYPAGLVATAALHTLFIYALGAALLWPLGPTWVVLYLAFCLWSEFRVLRGSCVNCAYYGKACAHCRQRELGCPAERLFRAKA